MTFEKSNKRSLRRNFIARDKAKHGRRNHRHGRCDCDYCVDGKLAHDRADQLMVMDEIRQYA